MPSKGYAVIQKVYEKIKDKQRVSEAELTKLIMQEAQIILDTYVKKYIDAMLKAGMIRKVDRDTYEPIRA